MITVTAIKDHVFKGRAVSAGDVFQVAPIEAAALKYQGVIALQSDTALTAQALRAAAPTPRRRYRRRDMTADVS